MNGVTQQPQESAEAVARTLEQLQALQLQQEQLRAQASSAGPSDADLLSLQLPTEFGGAVQHAHDLEQTL